MRPLLVKLTILTMVDPSVWVIMGDYRCGSRDFSIHAKKGQGRHLGLLESDFV